SCLPWFAFFVLCCLLSTVYCLLRYYFHVRPLYTQRLPSPFQGCELANGLPFLPWFAFYKLPAVPLLRSRFRLQCSSPRFLSCPFVSFVDNSFFRVFRVFRGLRVSAKPPHPYPPSRRSGGEGFCSLALRVSVLPYWLLTTVYFSSVCSVVSFFL